MINVGKYLPKGQNRNTTLTLNVPCISESCIEIKIMLNFYFHPSLCAKAFTKPFEAPQRSVKIKI